MIVLVLVVLAGLLVLSFVVEELRGRARDHEAEASHRRLLHELRRLP